VLTAVPNAAVLLSPLTIHEAVLSSRIEGTYATMEEVLEYEVGGQKIHSTRRRKPTLRTRAGAARPR
jgi:hypothetical protein